MGGPFDIVGKTKEITSIEEEMNTSGFWDNIDYANKLNKQLTFLKKETSEYNRLTKEITSSKEILELIELEYSEELLNELEESLKSLDNSVEELEINTLLSGEYDDSDCFLEIHPGAGGTESCDWAQMLYRMYTRWAYKNKCLFSNVSTESNCSRSVFLIVAIFSLM